MPETGSVLVAGHSPLGAFLRAAQVEPSVAGAEPTPFGCDDEDDIVEALEACDDSEEELLERWALLRGMSILKSSVLIGAAPFGTTTALDPLHRFWKFGGGATAVIDSKGAGRLPVRV